MDRTDRRSLWIGFLAGAWLATVLAIALPPLIRSVQAEDPPGGPAGGRQPFGPNGPTFPGPTVNPIDGVNRPANTYSGGGGTADSNNRAIALSASIGNGESVVYYFDTETRRLLVYQYRGLVGHNKPLGSGDSGGVRLLAARHMDYDLKLESYRDLSEKTRNELKETFETAVGKGGGRDEGEMATKSVELPGSFR
jgi:hypothetical protein